MKKNILTCLTFILIAISSCVLVACSNAYNPWDGQEQGCVHIYTTKTIAPTCIDEGYDLHTCLDCRDSYKDNYTSAIGFEGHDFDDYVCTVCDYFDENAPYSEGLEYEPIYSTVESHGSIYVLGYKIVGIKQYDKSYIKIPQYYNDLPVLEIDKHAFTNMRSTKYIVLPDTIEYIRDEAFRDCFGLKSINIPSSVRSIGKGAFVNCYKLTDIEFEKDGRNFDLEDDVFINTGFKSITIPKNIQKIKTQAFYSCLNLEEVIISEGVNEIEIHAFKECNNLKKIHIPKSVVYISFDAVEACGNLSVIEYNGTIEDWAKISGCGFDLLEEYDLICTNATVHYKRVEKGE